MNQMPLTPDQELLDLMRKKELREAKEFERKEVERAAAETHFESKKNRQIEADTQVDIAAVAWQSRCDHRKGTAGKKKWRHVDYMVDRHTLPNGTVRIRCQKCRFRAFPGDTKETCSYTLANFMLGAKRVKIKNPTRLSYSDWYQMTLDENTTNTETRSEMVTQGPVPVTA